MFFAYTVLDYQPWSGTCLTGNVICLYGLGLSALVWNLLNGQNYMPRRPWYEDIVTETCLTGSVLYLDGLGLSALIREGLGLSALASETFVLVFA